MPDPRPPRLPALTAAVEPLRADLGNECFTEVHHWEGDLMAIGLASPQQLDRIAYVALDDASLSGRRG